jgi:hypothetical protein
MFLAKDSDMSSPEISRRDWPAALERFSREHRGWLVTVGSSQEERALRSVAAGTDAVVVKLGDEELRIDAPTAIRVEDTGLEIEAGGRVTRLRFRTTARPETLDGIAPAER